MKHMQRMKDKLRARIDERNEKELEFGCKSYCEYKIIL